VFCSIASSSLFGKTARKSSPESYPQISQSELEAVMIQEAKGILSPIFVKRRV
jgi:hypothetical protein